MRPSMLFSDYQLSDVIALSVLLCFWTLFWLFCYQRQAMRSCLSGVPRVVVVIIGWWLTCIGWPLTALFTIDVPMLWFWRGLFGDLSVASLVIMMLFCCPSRYHHVHQYQVSRQFLFYGITLLGGVSYPFMLGVGMIDPYVWGYGQAYFIASVLLLAILALWFYVYSVVLWIVIAFIAWQLQLYESHNFWDYLLDPVAWLMATYQVIKQGLAKYKECE